jgi:hypothetical protein
MTETEWLACTDPTPMLQFLKANASGRKLRLFAIACCRPIEHLFPDERCNNALRVAERYAEGIVGAAELHAAWEMADEVAQGLNDLRQTQGIPAKVVSWAAANDAAFTVEESAFECAEVICQDYSFPQENALAWAAVWPRTREGFCLSALREIFGNPFRPVVLDSRWLTSTVVDLATSAIYDQRAFDRMPILADSLMDAGCDSDDILNHCRQIGEHARGCWALDLLLSKS